MQKLPTLARSLAKIIITLTPLIIVVTYRITSIYGSDGDGRPTEALPPLIIGAGPGTTGTHTIFLALCALGVPGVHWGLSCTGKFEQGRDQCRQPPAPPDAVISDAFRAHFTLIDEVTKLITCLESEHKRQRRKGGSPVSEKYIIPSDCPADMVAWGDEIRDLVDRVSVWSYQEDGVYLQNVQSVNDTPYPFLLPYLIESATRNRGGIAPVILLSERDPEQWALSRVKHYDPFCLDPIDVANRFNLLECIDRAAAARSNDDGPLAMIDVFTTYRLMTGVDGWEVEATLQFIAEGFLALIDAASARGVDRQFHLLQMIAEGKDTSVNGIAELIRHAVDKKGPKYKDKFNLEYNKNCNKYNKSSLKWESNQIS